MIIISSDEYLVLEDQLCFILYVCTKEVIKRYQGYLEKMDLTFTQYLTMIVLWNKDNISANELGRKLYLDSGTITPLLKKLEAKGLIERVVDTKDARYILNKVTQKGNDLKNLVKDVPEKILLETGVPIEEANNIKRLLTSILDMVNRT